MRDGLLLILGLEEDIRVVGVAGTVEEALELAVRHVPDVVLMDSRMPGKGGAGLRAIKKKRPQTAVLLLTTSDDEHDIVDALSGGAAGVLMKDISGERLIRSIRDAAAGQLLMPSSVAVKFASLVSALDAGKRQRVSAIRPSSQGALLSAREREVAKLLQQGRTNRDIAGRLFMSEGTVKNYVSSIYGKIGTNDRALAIVMLRDIVGE